MHNDKQPNWPTPLPAGKYEPSLVISSLTPEEKQILWKHLKNKHPEKAKAVVELMSDPVVLSMIDTFDASLAIESMFVPGCLLSKLE